MGEWSDRVDVIDKTVSDAFDSAYTLTGTEQADIYENAYDDLRTLLDELLDVIGE